MPTRRLLSWAIVASVLLHSLAYASLEGAPVSSKPASRKTQLRFDVVAKTPAAPTPPRARPDPPSPEPQQAPLPKVQPRKPPQPAEPASPPVAAADGVTLAGDGSGPGFAMPLGSGGALEPTRVRPAEPRHEPAPVPPARAPVKAEAALVAVGDLSARPSPPALGPTLARHYPVDARRRGLSGTAKVRARIDPDGVVRKVSLLEESAAGFGSACQRTLSGSRWAAPKDKAGRAVATEIRYTCRFVVE